MIEQCEDKPDDPLSATPDGGNTKSAIIAVVTHAMLPIAFIAFSVCVVPIFADRAQQSNIIAHGNVLLLFNISILLSDHIYICLGLLYVLLSLDAAVCLILFRVKKRMYANLWSWSVIVCQSAAMFFSVSVLYDFLKILIV